MKKFSKIYGFDILLRETKKYYTKYLEEETLPTVSFTGTVKLHGCNAGIHRTASGDLIPQSRNRTLSVDADHYGFAQFVARVPRQEAWDRIFAEFGSETEMTIFGEWCGKGIQGGVGISNLPDKQFVIFGACVPDGDGERYITNVDTACSPAHGIYNILRVPPYRVTLDLNDKESCSDALSRITEEVEAECPYAKSFDVSGIGEGVVWTRDSQPHDSRWWFKTKGEKHKNRGDKKTVEVDPVKLAGIQQCVDYLITEPRLNQGLEYFKEMNIELDVKNTGAFLKWVSKDCIAEDISVLDDNNLEWKEIAGSVNRKAKEFFFKTLEEL